MVLFYGSGLAFAHCLIWYVQMSTVPLHLSKGNGLGADHTCDCEIFVSCECLWMECRMELKMDMHLNQMDAKMLKAVFGFLIHTNVDF